ncbi:hypothetical protein SO802_017165 [Lithocarpus litseifolius]|uniref:Uncharacterized protein n=1 Tax=Lithocarpus litseifolius TaxID=425828 RepID=A0AAW2D130_9ROSI
MYSMCGNERSGYYLKARDTIVRLISCLPNSNGNLAGEFVRVSGNWLTDELTYPTSPKDVDTRRFRADPSVIHVRDLNFVIRSEIFVHFDSQLQAAHLILGHTLAYNSFQDPGQALTIDSPLLSYLDVRLQGFLPRGLTLGEAQRLGPQQIREGSLLPFKDGSVDRAFHARRIDPGQRQVEVESVDSSSEGTGPKDSNTEMVVRRIMMANRFLAGAWQAPPQQGPLSSTPFKRKRPRNTDEPTEPQGEVPSQTPPIQSTALLQYRQRGGNARLDSATGTCLLRLVFEIGIKVKVAKLLRAWAKPLSFPTMCSSSLRAVTLRLEWHAIAERLRSSAEDVEKEKTLKKVAKATM